jgi:hypothetical protein
VAFVIVGALSIVVAAVQHRRFIATAASDLPPSYSRTFALALSVLVGALGIGLAGYPVRSTVMPCGMAFPHAPPVDVSIMVRKLGPEHAPVFQALRLSGLRECPTAFASSYEEEYDRPLSLIADRLAAQDDRAVLGAFAGEELVGLVGIKREEPRSCRTRPTFGACT